MGVMEVYKELGGRESLVKREDLSVENNGRA